MLILSYYSNTYSTCDFACWSHKTHVALSMWKCRAIFLPCVKLILRKTSRWNFMSERKKSLTLLDTWYVHHGVRSDARISFVSGSFFTVLFSFCSILSWHGRRLQFRWGGCFSQVCARCWKTTTTPRVTVVVEKNKDASSITFVQYIY